MKILGIDTSCDDTAIAVLEIRNWKLEILSNVVSSQVKLHAKYGGVYPFLAKREHQRNLEPVFQEALLKARLLKSKIKNQKLKIDAIGVTVGPGLEPCLWQGVNFAKELAKKLNLPLVPVNHIEAHILANFVGENSKFEILNSKLFPAICLVVSGGHTQLIFMRETGKYKLIGETRDDAAGECFDKVARILGLGYPGGPVISQIAKKSIERETFSLHLPRPMIYQKNYDFSFSGLKTAVFYDFRKRTPRIRKSKKYIQEMSKEVQQAIIDVLLYKTIKAVKNFRVRSIILGGGVAANDELRKQFKETCLKWKFKHLVPPKNLCTDNAAMVGVAAFYHRDQATFDLEKIEVDANLKIS